MTYDKTIQFGKVAILFCSRLRLGFSYKNTTKLYGRRSWHINLGTVQISFNQ